MFRRTEFAKAFSRHPSDRAVTELLKYHLRAGNIRRIARGVFASVPKGALLATEGVDRLLAASRLRIGGVIAYRSALELHGYATTSANEVQHRLAVAAEALEDLRSLAPRHARYALGATPGHGRAGTGWNVILPTDIVERYFDD